VNATSTGDVVLLARLLGEMSGTLREDDLAATERKKGSGRGERKKERGNRNVRLRKEEKD
jgi:hypothetical protein